MLIFWKLILEEDLELYKQDPTTNVIALTSSPCNATSCITTLDRTINYIVGSFFILPFLSSTLLNPLLFWYFNSKKSKANTLFKILAVSDFFTTLFTPLTYTVIMLDKKLYASSNPALRQARPFCCIFGCISQVTTCLIALTRMVQIIFPFLYFRQKVVLIYLSIYTTYMVINNTTYYVALEFYTHLKTVQKIGLDMCIWPNFVHCLIGITASTTTVIYLLHKKRSPGDCKPQRNMRGCVTILMMNVPYFVTVVTILNVKLLLPSQVSFREILFAWLPFCTSGLNPIMILIRMKQARSAVKAKVMTIIGRSVDIATITSTDQLAVGFVVNMQHQDLEKSKHGRDGDKFTEVVPMAYIKNEFTKE